MARLLSVNVGLPKNVEWNGRTVRTGIWKTPLIGRCAARRLNLAGDGQGDLGGHGGENRAVFVYQVESYGYWKERLGRQDWEFGHFGENFTIEGLADEDVCVGDRYRIGTATFEITQPRVTCYRIGIRTGEPRMAALLTSSGRTGFYFRVIEEGDVGAGDDIIQVGQASERLTVAEVNALLYSSNHPQDKLERALQIDALSPGWRRSFEALLQAQKSGVAGSNAGLVAASVGQAVAVGFQPLVVSAIQRESADVLSLTFERADGKPVSLGLPGQYLALRLPRGDSCPPLLRSYSISRGRSAQNYRISVKLEPDGAAGAYFQSRLRVGDTVEVSSPRGAFVLREGNGPVVLVSAGIGVTPVLSMLHTLAEARSTRPIWWVHIARNRAFHPFVDEVRDLLARLPKARRFICYSRPDSDDEVGARFDAVGRLSLDHLVGLGIPSDAEAYVCGPQSFMSNVKTLLVSAGLRGDRIYSEMFGGRESLNPGVVGVTVRAPHIPDHDASTGHIVSFARSGISAHWDASRYQSVLDLAEACDVPVRWSCRSGVCHNCEVGLVSGSVEYDPAPMDMPVAGNVLICCSRPEGDVVIDA